MTWLAAIVTTALALDPLLECVGLLLREVTGVDCRQHVHRLVVSELFVVVILVVLAVLLHAE